MIGRAAIPAAAAATVPATAARIVHRTEHDFPKCFLRGLPLSCLVTEAADKSAARLFTKNVAVRQAPLGLTAFSTIPARSRDTLRKNGVSR
jgi:hypothetical protein